MRREPAWRIFADEYNSSSHVLKGSGEKTPSYVITPLGAKVNRMFVIGVLTDVESLTEGNDLVRAHVSDPTGVYTLYSGQFQPEVTSSLLNADVPTFLAFVGKVRVFEPEEGVIYLSVRPESVYEVDGSARDRWIIEACKNTWERINAMKDAMNMLNPTINDLIKLGYSRELSEGVVKALEVYGNIDLDRYLNIIEESLNYLIPREKVEKEIEERVSEKDIDEMENTVLEIIREIEGEKGVQWDDVVEKCREVGIDKETVEEIISSLLDKGLVYEPVLGTIKTT